MAQMPSRAELKAEIAQAMQAATPKAYLQAKASGKLDAILTDRADAAIQTYDRMIEQAQPQIEAMNSLQAQMQESRRVKSAALETAVSQAVEFAPEQNPTDPTGE